MTDELFDLFSRSVPLLDVRAPVEFTAGAFPTTTNLPILDDSERQLVGICYKNKGPAAAESLGYELVSGVTKADRIASWVAYSQANPTAHMYCFRGGQRSRIAAQWLAETGIHLPRIAGGYKRMRQYLLQVFDHLPELFLVSGKTGVGKTVVLSRLLHQVDLEGLANHRGSAFGKRLTPQPGQVDFENQLAIKLLGINTPIAVEDESRLIGRIHLPPAMQVAMGRASVVVVEDTLLARTERIRAEYVSSQLAELTEAGVVNPMETLESLLNQALQAISKRLGGARYIKISTHLARAFELHRRHNDLSGHNLWIEALLTGYYDPMYEYQLKNKADRIVFRGNHDAVIEWLTSQCNRPGNRPGNT